MNDTSNRRRTLIAGCSAHAVHDGLTDVIYVLLPIWQAQFALSYAQIGLLRGAYSGMMAVFQLMASRAAKRWGRVSMLVGGTALAGAAYLMVGQATGWVMLLLALLLGGLGASTQHPLASSMISDAYEDGGGIKQALSQYNFSGDIGKGELLRSFWQFKSFSIGMIMRHGARGMAQEGWGKAGYLAALVASTTVLGGMAIQLGEVAAGRDPKDITDDKKWGVPGLRFGLASFLKGGAMGLYGDFLFSDTSQGGSSPLAALGGPIAGDLEAIFKLKDNAADGEVNQTGGKLVRLAKSHLPGANLWYTKAATDHLIFNQLQDYFSPGYLRRMKQRARKEFNQSYWWEPGDSTPDRAPNLGAVVGAK